MSTFFLADNNYPGSPTPLRPGSQFDPMPLPETETARAGLQTVRAMLNAGWPTHLADLAGSIFNACFIFAQSTPSPTSTYPMSHAAHVRLRSARDIVRYSTVHMATLSSSILEASPLASHSPLLGLSAHRGGTSFPVKGFSHLSFERSSGGPAVHTISVDLSRSQNTSMS